MIATLVRILVPSCLAPYAVPFRSFLSVALLIGRRMNRRPHCGVHPRRRAAMADGDRKNPGDEDAPGSPQTGEDICPTCEGSGRLDRGPCPDCGGSGRVTVIVGDA
jgi:hypothetical protein